MKNINVKVWTAIITPFDDKGDIDFTSYLGLLKKQEAAGNGIVILGSTGEALNISQKEREAVAKYVAEQNIKAPIMVGVGGSNLGETLEWLRFLEHYQFDAYLMVTPIYAKPGDVGQKMWFESLLNAVTKPCMLYNVPSRAGKELSLKAVSELKGHKNFWAIKEASGSIEKFSQYVQAAPNQKIYSGDDGMMPYFASLGSVGVVSVASNAWPAETLRYVELCLEGKYHQAYPLWEKACNALFTASNPIPVKALIHAKGWIKSSYLRPPLTIRDFYKLEELIQIDNEVNQWFTQQGKL